MDGVAYAPEAPPAFDREPDNTNVEDRLTKTAEVLKQAHEILSAMTDHSEPNVPGPEPVPEVGIEGAARVCEQRASSLCARIKMLRERLGRV